MPSKAWDEIPYPFPNYIVIVITYPWWDLKEVRGFVCIFPAHTQYLINFDKFGKPMAAKCMIENDKQYRTLILRY